MTPSRNLLSDLLSDLLRLLVEQKKAVAPVKSPQPPWLIAPRQFWEAPYATVEERFSAPTMQFHRTLPFS